jgi:hypothetical protein
VIPRKLPSFSNLYFQLARLFLFFQVFFPACHHKKTRITDVIHGWDSMDRLFPEKNQPSFRVSLKQSGVTPAVIPWNESRGLVLCWTASP